MKRCPASVRGALVVRGRRTALIEHPHRHQHDLERDEEEHGVAGGEHGERAGLDDQQARRGTSPGAALGHVDPRVRGDQHPDQARQQHERHGDAVDAERPAHPELGQPGQVDVGPRRRSTATASAEGDAGGGGRHDPGARGVERAATGDEPEADGGGNEQEQAHDHASTPARPSTTTAAEHEADGRAGPLAAEGAGAGPPRRPGGDGGAAHVGVDRPRCRGTRRAGRGGAPGVATRRR